MSDSGRRPQSVACPVCETRGEPVGATYLEGVPRSLFVCDPCGVYWRIRVNEGEPPVSVGRD